VKRPAFQFYPADWRSNAKLRRCTDAARGAWMDVLCVLHDSDEYGVVRYPLAELARAAGVPLRLLKELAAKDVLKGGDRNAPAYVFTPVHAGKSGQPVTLVEASEGPCWYSTRFVRDEHVRQKRGGSTRFTEDNQPPKQEPKDAPKPPIGDGGGDGASSALASASAFAKSKTSEAVNPSPPAADVPGNGVVLTGTFEGHDGIPAQTPNPVARFAIALIDAGFQVTALNPKLIAYVDAGGTVEHLQAIAAMPDCAGKATGYVLGFAIRELTAPKVSVPESVAIRNQSAAAAWLAQEPQ